MSEGSRLVVLGRALLLRGGAGQQELARGQGCLSGLWRKCGPPGSEQCQGEGQNFGVSLSWGEERAVARPGKAFPLAPGRETGDAFSALLGILCSSCILLVARLLEQFYELTV